MKIKEVCERTGLTERTVRFYRQKGLISPRGEWRNGREYSDFSEADVEMLAAIATLRELSFSIDEILTMQRTPGAIPDIVLARREAARKEHEIAENTFAVLERLDAAGVPDVAALASRARDAAAYRPHPAPPPRPEEVNESGMGERCHSVPLELMGKWNWGAFLFPVIWGLANHVYQALWCFIPVIGFFYAFHLGSHGNEFAWKHRYWESIAHFKRVQRRFAAWSIGITVAAIALYIGAAIASNRAAERAERIYETRLAALDESIKGTPEWQSLAGSRTLWTDALAKEKFDAYPTEQARQEAGILNRDDAFYLEPDAYYQVLRSNYYDFDEGECGHCRKRRNRVQRYGQSACGIFLPHPAFKRRSLGACGRCGRLRYLYGRYGHARCGAHGALPRLLGLHPAGDGSAARLRCKAHGGGDFLHALPGNGGRGI